LDGGVLVILGALIAVEFVGVFPNPPALLRLAGAVLGAYTDAFGSTKQARN
jgi:hypothetical protein